MEWNNVCVAANTSYCVYANTLGKVKTGLEKI